MKELIYFSFLIAILFLLGCVTHGVMMTDTDCLRKVNTIVANELKEDYVNDSVFDIKDIKILMKFYIKENGKADSIVFIQSNLNEKGINEKQLINRLMKQSYKCIRLIYYAHKPYPDEVTIVFNPNL